MNVSQMQNRITEETENPFSINYLQIQFLHKQFLSNFFNNSMEFTNFAHQFLRNEFQTDT